MARYILSVGMRFGMLTIIGIAQDTPRVWLCRCDCGEEKSIRNRSLGSGNSKSCGCGRNIAVRLAITKHGYSGTRIYNIWSGMMDRCYEPSHHSYGNYGGRGIRVCERWHDVQTFAADMLPIPTGRTLDRVNNDGNYTPENCRWATPSEQQRNTRRARRLTFDGRTESIATWAEEKGMSLQTLLMRLRVWPVDKALTQPLRRWSRRTSDTVG